jgi:hypothetical protein
MLKKLGPARFGGDDNVCELTRVCPTCEGTTSVPPQAAGFTMTTGMSNDCPDCKTGLVVQRFKSVDELKAFAAAL